MPELENPKRFESNDKCSSTSSPNWLEECFGGFKPKAASPPNESHGLTFQPLFPADKNAGGVPSQKNDQDHAGKDQVKPPNRQPAETDNDDVMPESVKKFIERMGTVTPEELDKEAERRLDRRDYKLLDPKDEGKGGRIYEPKYLANPTPLIGEIRF